MTERPTTTGTATSRADFIRPAVRKPTKARLAMSGASGSGKTWTALSIAQVIEPQGRTIVIDTEPSDDLNTAAELYSDHFEFDLIDWRQGPFDPRDLALTIKELGTKDLCDVLIVDSGSAFWRKEGGTLDIAGGTFGGWRSATPAQEQLVDAILNAPFHVIFCTRAKQDYQVDDSGGQMKVTKRGLAPIQRDDIEYEFQVVVMMDDSHRIDIGKTRCETLAGKSFHANQQMKFAAIFKEWLDRGPERLRQWQADAIVAALKIVPAGDERLAAGSAFLDRMGAKPNEMTPDLWDSAWLALSEIVSVPAHPFVARARGGQDDPVDLTCADCGLDARVPWHLGSQPPDGPESPPDDPPVGETEPDPVEAQEPAEKPVTGRRETELHTTVGEMEQVSVERDLSVLNSAEVPKWVDALSDDDLLLQITAREIPIPDASNRAMRTSILKLKVQGYANQVEVDPIACTECGGYIITPPPGGRYCECTFG